MSETYFVIFLIFVVLLGFVSFYNFVISHAHLRVDDIFTFLPDLVRVVLHSFSLQLYLFWPTQNLDLLQ